MSKKKSKWTKVKSGYQPNRRRFLRDSALTAGFLAGPGRFLFGCASSDSNSSPAENTGGERSVQVSSVHHFDLAHSDPELEHTLVVGTKRYPLVRHDEETRNQARDGDDFITGVPDKNLTHYAENVVFPADGPQLYQVHATDPGAELPVVALFGLHLPTSGIESA